MPSEQPHVHTTEKHPPTYSTPVQAARTMGVSYQTVSRAVREGRLRVRRLGRDALIAAADLGSWQPSQVRPAQRNRSRGRSRSASRGETAMPAPERVQALKRFIEQRSSAASLEELLRQLTAALARVVELDWVGVWFVSDDGTRIERTGEFGSTSLAPLGSSLPRSDQRSATLLALTKPTVLGADFTEASPPTLLAAPLKFPAGPSGFILGTRGGSPLNLTSTDLAIVELLLTAATAPLSEPKAPTESQTEPSPIALVELLPDPAAIVDADGEIRAANTALRDLFNLSSRSPAENIFTLVSGEERIADPDSSDLSASTRLLAESLREGWSRDIMVSLPTLEQTNGALYRLSVWPLSKANAHDEQVYLITFRLPEPTEWSESEIRGRSHLAQIEVSAARAASMARLSQAINSGISLDSVLQVAIERLTTLLDGDRGAIYLRTAADQYLASAQVGFDEQQLPELELTDAMIPTTVQAIRAGRPIYHHYEESSATEREIFDRLGFQAATIAPLALDNEVIGVAYVTFSGPHRVPTGEDLRYAAALADQCAVAIGRTRLMERWEMAHRRLLTVIDQLPQGVVIVDAPDGTLVLANRAAESFWQRSLAGTAEKPPENVGDLLRTEGTGSWPFHNPGNEATPQNTVGLGSLLPIYDSEGLPFPPGETPLERTLRTGEPRLGEPLIIPRPDGTTITVVGNHVPILDNQGHITGAVSVLQDVAQLKELDRAKDEFLSVVAHELRNPLTSLRGNLQLLSRRLHRQNDPSRQEEIERIDGILRQVDRIGQLVTRLLDVSRADLGRLDLSLSETDASAMIASAVQTAQGLTKQHHFVVNIPDTFPVVWDTVRIEQVLENLLSNAVKYAVPGDVTVTLTPGNDGWFTIAVEDQGPGIPDYAKARLFERYYRANRENPSSQKAEGLGIGLYVSHQIVVAHGGTLTVSDSPSGGSVFTITLPTVAQPTTAQSTTTPGRTGD